jgi:hypothetical protein
VFGPADPFDAVTRPNPEKTAYMARLSGSARLPEPEPDPPEDMFDEPTQLVRFPPSESAPVAIPPIRRLPALQPLPALRPAPPRRMKPPKTMETAPPTTPPLERVTTSRRRIPSLMPELKGRGERRPTQARGTIQTRAPEKPAPAPHESLLAAFIPSEDLIPSPASTHRSVTLPTLVPSRRLGVALLLLASGALAAAVVWLSLIY